MTTAKKKPSNSNNRRAAAALARAVARPRVMKRRVAIALTLAPLTLGWAARTGTTAAARGTRALASTLAAPITPLTHHPQFNRSHNTWRPNGQQQQRQQQSGSSKRKQWSKQRAADWALGMPIMVAAAPLVKKAGKARNRVRKTWSKPLKAGETRATRAKNVLMLGAVPAADQARALLQRLTPAAKRAGSAAKRAGSAAVRGARTWWATRRATPGDSGRLGGV